MPNGAEASREEIYNALLKLDGWLRRHQFQGYEPFDGLNSNLRPLTLGTKFGRQTLVQLVKRCPVNLRSITGVRPATSTKGMGFAARGYLRWYQASGDEQFKAESDRCLSWLRENRSIGYSGPCWGNHFDYQTRTYYLPAGSPTIVWSALIGHAFVDSFEATARQEDLDEARGTCEFILRDLPRQTKSKGICISYVAHDQVEVHNANALGASLLSRVYRHTREPELFDVATKALTYTVGCQNTDGSWYYGERDDLRWIDNWHTAYVLDSLLDYEQNTGDERFKKSCVRGLHFYREHFFLRDGCSKYYQDEIYPIDIQCAAQSVESLCRFSKDAEDIRSALKVARWAIVNMQDPSGYFYFQRHRHYINRTPCFHWGQATMLSALALLLRSLYSREGHAHEALISSRTYAN